MRDLKNRRVTVLLLTAVSIVVGALVLEKVTEQELPEERLPPLVEGAGDRALVPGMAQPLPGPALQAQAKLFALAQSATGAAVGQATEPVTTSAVAPQGGDGAESPAQAIPMEEGAHANAVADSSTVEQTPTMINLFSKTGAASATGGERVLVPPPDPNQDPDGHDQWRRGQEIHLRFQQGVVMLRSGELDNAIVAFNRVLELNPRIAEAAVNMGYAYIGMQRYEEAFQAFDHAVTVNPGQANAYYGMAMAAEGLGDLRLAMEGMRTFLHLSKENEVGENFINRARSALWEWEARLGEGPWGPTRGIPPGFTEEELKRDGTGVGVHGLKRSETNHSSQETATSGLTTTSGVME